MDVNQLFFKYGIYFPAVLVQGQKVPLHLRSLNKTQWAPPDRLEAIQNKKLQALLAYAKSAIPYYQESLRGVAIESRFSLERLATLPFVKKAELQANQKCFVQTRGAARLTRKTTGGSTGQAVTIWKTAEAIAQEHAANWRGFDWAGISIGDRQARFWGVAFRKKDRLKARIADFIANRKRCSAFSFAEREMLIYTRRLNRFKPRYFYGYVSMLTAYADYLRSSGDRLGFDLQAVIPTSEVLTSYHRQLFQDSFGARVFNEYGCGELGTIAHECEKGSMHVNAENLIIEILKGDRPCGPHEIGEIVATDLNNTGMPLVRYRLGDFGSLSSAPCPCGRTLPIIENIAGRAYDLVYNRDGRMFHGEFFMYIFEEVKRENLGIGSFQVVQKDFEHFIVKVVPTSGYRAETERLISERIRQGYGSYAQISFVPVSEIGREPSGKMRLIVGMESAKSTAYPDIDDPSESKMSRVLPTVT
jgi:phenylacetate-CoA ligase